MKACEYLLDTVFLTWRFLQVSTVVWAVSTTITDISSPIINIWGQHSQDFVQSELEKLFSMSVFKDVSGDNIGGEVGRKEAVALQHGLELVSILCDSKGGNSEI